MSDCAVPGDTAAPGSVHAWQRGVLAWHLLFVGLLALTALLVAVNPEGGMPHRLAALGVVAAIAGAYAALALPALRDPGIRLKDHAYVAIVVVLTPLGFAFRPEVALLLFAVYPQVWRLRTRRSAVIWTLVLSAAIGTVTVLVHDQPPVSAMLQSGIALVVSILLGLWIEKIIVESTARADTIAELERTRAELAAVSHDAGVLAERERLAREIHDTLAQGFTSVLMLLELAESDVDTNPAAARRRLAVANQTVRQNLAEARSLVAALTPVDLQAAPLPEAVGRLVDRFARESGLPVRLDVEGAAHALPAATEVVLLRAAQESLANVGKHAGPCEVTVRLRYAAGGTELEVADGGAGFVQDGTPSPGYGLAGMRRRVEEAGGELRVDSTPGTGTTVKVRLP